MNYLELLYLPLGLIIGLLAGKILLLLIKMMGGKDGDRLHKSNGTTDTTDGTTDGADGTNETKESP